MTIYPTPEQDIQAAYDLYKSLVSKGGANAPRNLFLYFAQGSLGLEKKRSWAGLKLRVQHLISKKGEKPLTIETNLQKLSEIFERSSRAEDIKFQKAASNISKKEKTKVTADQLKKNITILAEGLKDLRAHVQAERTRKGRKAELPEIPMLFTQIITPKPREDIYNQFLSKKMGPKLDVNSIVEFIATSPEADLLNQVLFDEQASPEDVQKTIAQALLRAITIEKDSEKVDEYKKLIEQLSPERPRMDLPHGLKKIAMVFGDHFIKGTGFEEKPSSKKVKGQKEDLEGDFSSQYIDLLLEFFRTSGIKAPKIQTMLQQYINLKKKPSVKEVQTSIQQQLEKPESSCLLFGGWMGHAVGYEIERQKNGKYTFRVYNKSDGIQYHVTYRPQYSEKEALCIDIKDISKENILNPEFLGSLIGLCTMKEDATFSPADFLATYLLPTLNGKQGMLPSSVQLAASPQRSGTCSWMWLTAFFANKMSQQDDKLFSIQFKTFLLDQFEKETKHEIAKPLTDRGQYDQRRVAYAVIKRAVEQFASNLYRLETSGEILPEVRRDARQKIDEYKLILKDMEKTILDFEKKQAPSDSLDRCTIPISTIVQSHPTAPTHIKEPQVQAASTFIPPTEQNFLNAIRALPLSTDPKFSERFEQILNDLVDSRTWLADKAFLTISDQLFRKISSLETWETIKYKNPVAAVHNLSAISKRLSAIAGPNERAEVYLMFLFAAYGLEQAYIQCPNVPMMDKNCSILYAANWKLDKIQCSDGFWVSCRQKLKLLKYFHGLFAQINAVPRARDPQKRDEGQELDQKVARAVWNWWESDVNKERRAIVAESIKKDRATQKVRIEKKIATTKVEKKTLEGELTKNNKEIGEKEKNYDANKKHDLIIKKSEKEQELIRTIDDTKIQELNNEIEALGQKISTYETLEHRLSELRNREVEIKAKIPELESKINGGIEKAVEEDPQYWPKGFEFAPGEKDALDPIRYKAPFLFIPQEFFTTKGLPEEDLFPLEFRRYCVTAILSNSIFFKKSLTGTGYALTPTLDNESRKAPTIKIFFPVDEHSYDKSQELTDIYSKVLSPEGLGGFYGDAHKPPELGAPQWITKPPDIKLDYSESLFFITDRQAAEARLKFDEKYELHALRSSSYQQLDALLSFAEEDLSRLKENKWLNLFHALLFDSDLLLQELNDDIKRESLLHRMRELFTKGVRGFTESESVEAAANLIWLARSVENYTASISAARCQQGKKPLVIDPPLVDDKLFVDLFTKTLDPRFKDNQSAVFRTLFDSSAPRLNLDLILAQISKGIKESDAESFAVTCLCLLFDSHIRSPGEACNPKDQNERDSLENLKELLTYTTRDHRALTPFTEFIQNAFTKYAPQKIEQFYPNLRGCRLIPFYKNDADLYYVKDQSGMTKGTISLSSGQFVPIDQSAFRQYREGLGIEDQKKLTDTGLFTTEQCIQMRCYKERDQCHIKVNENLRICIEEKDLYIQTSPTSPWQHYVDVHFKGEPETGYKYVVSVVPHELGRRYVGLQKGIRLYFCDKKTFQPVYMQEDEKIWLLCEGKKTDLHVAKPPPSLARFEDPSCTICLVDSTDNPVEVQFPRLDITLQCKDGHTVFKQHPEWSLSQTQFVPGLGVETGFLLLEKQDGTQKVILPIWDPQPEKKRALDFPYKYDFLPEANRTARYIECGYKQGELVPTNLQARYYLARIFLERGDLDRAEALLTAHDAMETKQPLTIEEKQLLHDIAYINMSKDIGARAARMRALALLLLEKNDAQFPSPEKKLQPLEEIAKAEAQKKQSEEDLKVINEYLEKMHGAICLDEKDEFFLLRRVVAKQKGGILPISVAKRINELEGGVILGEKPTITPFEVKRPPAPQKPPLFEEKEPPKSLKSFFERVLKHMIYYVARTRHTFPFDPTTVTGDHLKDFYTMLKDEASNLGHFSTGKRNGLIPALQYMMFFSEDSAVRYMAYEAHSRLVPVITKEQKDAAYELLAPSEIKGVQSRPSLPLLVQRDLCSLKHVPVSTEEPTFCSMLCTDYFTEAPRPPRGVGIDVISPACAEIGTNKAVQKKFDLTLEDIKEAQKPSGELTYAKKPEMALGTFRATVDQEIAEAKKVLARQEENITTAVTYALTAGPAYAQFAGKKRSLPTMIDLCILAARPKERYLAAMKQRFPEISNEGVERLRTNIQHYLIQKQFIQQLERAKTRSEGINESDPPEVNQPLYDDLGNVLNAQREYKLDDENAYTYIFIETVLNIKLRKQQVESIKNLIQSMRQGKGVVQQTIMGGGKSSVYQPILGLLLAEPGSVSVVEVPESLFDQAKKSLGAALGESFEQYVFVMDYNRTLSKDPNYVELFFQKVKEAQERGACFLRNPKLKHSIITSMYEAFYDLEQNPSEENRKRVEAIAKLCQFLQLNEKLQMDEVDVTMNPLVTFKFPKRERGAKMETVNPRRGTILAQFLFDFASDMRLANQISIDFVEAFQNRLNPQRTKQGKSLTNELFSTQVQKELATKAKDALFPKIQELKAAYDQDSQKYLDHFLLGTTPLDDQIKLLDQKQVSELTKLFSSPEYTLERLRREAKSQSEENRLVASQILFRKACVEWITDNVSNNEDKELIGVCAKAITKILKKSLFKECGAQYGEDTRDHLNVARPYYAPEACKETMFADPYEQVIYTVQKVLYYGIPPDKASEMLKRMQKDAREEMIEGGTDITTTASYKRFQKLLGSNWENFQFLQDPPSAQYLKAFHEAINEDKESFVEYLNTYVFPEIKVHSMSISSTPQTDAGSCAVTGGYTGTLAESILPLHTEVFAEKGVDGKTMLAVEEKMKDTGIGKVATVENFHAKDGKELDQAIKLFSHDPDYYVFIDSGGWLKEEKIEVFAERLLRSCQEAGRHDLHGVVFKNEKGETVSLEEDASSHLVLLPVELSTYGRNTTKGEALTVIAEKFEIGTNILQKPRAKALLSVRKNMAKRDGLQSSFRMRQILYGQAVSLAITDEVRDDIVTGIVDGLKAKIDPKQDFLAQISSLPKNVRIALEQAYKEKGPDIPSVLEQFAASFPVDSFSIWRYMTTNEATIEQKKTWVAAQQKMRELVEKPVRMALEDLKIPVHDRLALFSAMKQLFIQKKEDSPFKEMAAGTIYQTAQEAIDTEIEKYMKLVNKLNEMKTNQAVVAALNNMSNLYPKGIEQELKSPDLVKAEDIPPFIEVGEELGENEIEQEIEHEEESEKEEEIEIEVETISEPLSEKSRVELWEEAKKILPFSRQERSSPLPIPQNLAVSLKESGKITYSPNMFPDHSLSSFYNPPGRYVLAIKDKSQEPPTTRYIVISHEDEAVVKKGIVDIRAGKAHRESQEEFILKTFEGETIATTYPGEDVDNEEFLRVRVEAKIYTGRKDFSREEIECLTNMVTDEKGKVDGEKVIRLRDAYEAIISKKPEIAKAYPTSALNKFFTKFAKSAFVLTPTLAELQRNTNKDIRTANIFEVNAFPLTNLIALQNRLRTYCDNNKPKKDPVNGAYSDFRKYIEEQTQESEIAIALGLSNRDNKSKVLRDAKRWIRNHLT